MDPLDRFDRFLRRPLEDVLVSQGIITRERVDEMVESATSTGVPLGTVVLESGVLTPWEFAKTVAAYWQLPVQPLAGYHFDKELLKGLKASMLHRHQVLPIGVFGNVRTFAILEPPSRPLLEDLILTVGASLFFFVAEGHEIARHLNENVKVLDVDGDGTWKKLFDSAEQEVAKDLNRTRA